MNTTLSIRGMHCESCEALLADVLSDVPGVASVVVRRETQNAIIEHDATVTVQQLRAAIEGEGYDAS